MKSATMQASSLRAGTQLSPPVTAKPIRGTTVVCKAVDDSARLAALADALRTGMVLKKQVSSEKQRADSSMSQLQSAGNNYNDAEFRQSEEIRTQRYEAEKACMKAAQALEEERRKIEQLIASNNGGTWSADLVEQERAARMRAEQISSDLERRLNDVQSRLRTTVNGVIAGSNAAVVADEVSEMMDKAKSLNNTLRDQLSGQMARSAAAKELAVNRAKELESMSSRAREQQKMLKMLQQESQAAEAQVKRAHGELDEAEKQRHAIMKSVQAAAQAAQAAETSKNNMYEARKKIAAEEERMKMVMVDSGRLDSLRLQLNQIERANEEMKAQVQAEGARASVANRTLAKYTNLIKEEASLKQQLSAEVARKQAAMQAAQAAKAAVEQERVNIDRIMREAGPALKELEDVRADKARANEVAAQLESQLRQANDRLEKQGRVIESAEKVLSASPSVNAAELAEAEAIIATMIKQVQFETQRKAEAQEQARARQAELQYAAEKLKDMDYRYKAMMAALETARASVSRTAEQLRSAPAGASSAVDRDLQIKLEQETKRADALEREAEALRSELDRVRSQKSSETSEYAVGASEEDAEFMHIQEAIKSASAENESLKAEVLVEGQKATTGARDLAQANAKVSEMESMLQNLRGEVVGMKTAMSDLRNQMTQAVEATGKKAQKREIRQEATLRKATKELQKSQKQFWCTVM